MPYGQWWTRSYQSQGTMLQSGNRRENRIVVGAILVSFAFAMAAESKLVKQQVLISVTMEMRCFHKKLEFQRYPPKISVPLAMSANLRKIVSNFSKTPKKIFPGPILGQDRPENNSAKCLFEAARFRVLDRHRSTKPTTAP